MLDAPFAGQYCTEMRERYPDRELIPFAKRCDNDNVACFEIGKEERGKRKEERVEIIHDFADPGWEQAGGYDNFWNWFEDAVKELIERAREDEREGG